MQLRWKLNALVLLAAWIAGGIVTAGQDQRPTFRSGASRVSLNVVVKDNRGRPIRGLATRDFQVFDEERLVQLDDFGAGDQSVSIAVLMDTSGSMGLGSRVTSARQIAAMLFAQFQSGDEAALFAFDKRLEAVTPFTTNPEVLQHGLDRIDPWGSTSLHDAVAAAARQLASRPSLRRAVIAITDGLDNSSQLSAAAASGVASLSDVPVYVLAVADSDRKLEASEIAREPVLGGGVARLDELTAQSGGASFTARSPAETNLAVRHILTDLRAGYLFGFTPSDAPGWHRLTVRVSRKDAHVRTRAGFWMTSATGSR